MGEKYRGAKRTAVLVLSILILIFVTTPAALVQLFSGTDDVKLFWISWAKSESPSLFNRLVLTILPPLTVILINQVLLYIIYILGTRKSLSGLGESAPLLFLPREHPHQDVPLLSLQHHRHSRLRCCNLLEHLAAHYHRLFAHQVALRADLPLREWRLLSHACAAVRRNLLLFEHDLPE